MNDTEIIGYGLLGFGTLFFILGILFLLDRAMLIMSNILIFMGIIVLMKPKGFIQFVIQKDKMRGSVAFLLGILLVLFKIPFLGIICEVVGAYWLFGGFIPMLISLLVRVPFFTKLLPFLSKQKEDTETSV